MSIKRIGAPVIAGLFLLTLLLLQVALAAGPEISNVQVPDISFASATITWTTNNASDSRVNYGTDRSKNATWEHVHDATAVTHHSIHLEGLTPGETYYFEVQSTDGSETATDNNGGEYYSFKTLKWYSISLNPIAGSCAGEEITVTATVAASGRYYICWDSLTNDKKTFTASTPGVYEVEFSLPGAVKGDHKVYLTDNSYTQKGDYAIFTVNPSVQIDPDEGPVGTVVTLSGCGFAASQDIQVKFKDTVIHTVQTTSNGTWPSKSYTIPDTPSSDYDFLVEVDGAAWVIRGFEVTPKITVSSSSGIVGHTIEIKGRGFQSKEKDIEITFDGEVVKTNIPIVADGNGYWEASIVVPPLRRGTHTVDASGRSTRARDVPDIEDFVVGAGIFVEPPGAHCVGDTITVKGGGFATSETGIRLTFGGTEVASGITAKQDGTWEHPFDLPPSAYGPHNVEASGDTTRSAVKASLSIQARILEISRSSGAPGDLVSITGDGFGSSEQLTVAIAGIAAPDSMRTQPNGNVAVSFHVPARSPEGKQTLVVSDGSGASASDEFTVTTKTLSTTPLPISPKDNTLRSGVVTFSWQAVPSGSDFTYTYTLELSRTAGGGSFWSLENISASNYTWSEDNPLENGTYYWRVKMTDDYGNEGDWSEPVEFRVSKITIPIWAWVVIGVAILIVLMYVAYRETKFKVTE